MVCRGWWLGLVLAVAAHAATADKLRSFDLSAGPAMDRLLQFSEQAGTQLLFPADLVQELQTKPVSGNLEPRVALERMLAGTELIVVGDEATGSLQVQRAQAQATGPIVLPPLSVTTQGVPWKITETPGFTFLSHCTDTVTKGYVQGMTRAVRILELLVPSEFMLKSDLSQIIILSPQGRGSSMSQELLNNYSPATGEPAAPVSVGDLFQQGALRGVESRVLAQFSVRVVRDLELIDRDRAAIFTSVEEPTFDGSRLFVRPSHFEYLLKSRRPALPEWVVAGLMKLYENADNNFQSDGLLLAPLVWINGYESRQMAKDANRAQALMPLADFFHAPASPQRDAQAALFVRWALDSWVSARESNYTRAARAAKSGVAAQPNRDAFWKFVSRAATEPMTETIFHDCFGLTYAEMKTRLTDYLKDAVRVSVRLRLDAAQILTLSPLRDATSAEVAQIKGDWERIEANFVKVQQPQYAQSYAYQTRSTLMSAYRDGAHDPATMAVIGLYECNLGNDDAALPFLEAAVGGKVVRPAAYYELARIRYAMAKAKPAGRGQKLSAEQTAGVIAPLVAGHLQSPPLREIFDLAAVAWSNSDVALTRRDLALLETALKFFPQDADLYFKAALINAGQGYKTEAARLVERGLKVTRETDDRGRLLDVLSKVDPDEGMQPIESFRFVERRTPKAAFEAVVWAAHIGAEGALTSSLNLPDGSRSRADALRRELAAGQNRPEYASAEKLAALSYRVMFDDVTGIQVLEQGRDGDGPVMLGVRLRKRDDTIDTVTFGFLAGPGGWQLVVPEDQFEQFRKRLVARQLAAGALRGTVADGRKGEPEVLVVSDIMAQIPEQLRPQPGQPVYYQILSNRQSDIGSTVANEPRPEAAVVEREVIRALAEQGFMQTGPRGPRSGLAIVIEYGSANLDVDQMTMPAVPTGGFSKSGADAKDMNGNNPNSDDATAPIQDPQTIDFAFGQREMEMLIGVDKANRGILTPHEAAELNASLQERRGYIFVGAFDALSVAQKKPKLLWRTRMSIGSLHHTLPDSLAAMLASGAPLFGQNLERPIFVREKDRNAEVKIGTPVVVPDDRPAPPSNK